MLLAASVGALIDDPSDAHRSGSGGVAAARRAVALASVARGADVDVGSAVVAAEPPQTGRGALSPSPLAPFGGYDGICEALDEHG